MLKEKPDLRAAAQAVIAQGHHGKMLIGGRMVEALSGARFDSFNPATGEIVGSVPDAGAADVALAVTAALAAQGEWADLDVGLRAQYLRDFAGGLEARAVDLLLLEVLDSGNTITGMSGDIRSGIERLRYFAGLGYELQGATLPSDPKRLLLTLREPYGVVGRIAAFNHPFTMIINGVAGALMAGNAVIAKPSEQCPLSATLIAEIAAEHLPAGVLNIVTGGRVVGDAIVRAPDVKKISFVGSAPTGMAIQRSAAEVAVKSVALELGGKNPFIVYPDADLQRVAAAAIDGMNFTWQGQSCSSTSRLFLHEDIYDEVLPQVTALAQALIPGDPMSWDSRMGAINSQAQLEKTETYVKNAISQGARLVSGGSRPIGPLYQKGWWYLPTVLADVTQEMQIAREEVFGPVLSVLKWRDEAEVLAMANSVDLGLTGAIWTGNISTALRMARRVRAGYLWINGVNSHPRALAFGGVKNSGLGRERSLAELYAYTEEKSVQIFL